MPLNRSDLGDFAYFMAIARHGSFRKAALDVGVTPSALSHAISGLEERLGIRLFNRTTRSVTLTAAGEALFASISNPLDTIATAVEDLNRFRDKPAGRIRLSVLEDAAALLLEPVLPQFIERYPDVEVDLSVDNRMIDVTAGGFDAGIRHGGTVPADMIAQRLSEDFRWITAASPSYISQYGAPERPEDLASHRCVRVRLGNDRIYDWEFLVDGAPVSVETPGQITLGHSQTMISMGIRGAGLIYGPEPVLAPLIKQGSLKPVLQNYAPTGPGYHIYYSSRRHVPTGLRLLIDMIRETGPRVKQVSQSSLG